MTKQNNDHTGWYANYLKAWRADWGSKPTNDQLAVAHAFGRPGKQSLALAMSLRSEGVTAETILKVVGKPQNNHRNGLVSDKLFKRIPVPADGRHQVYKLELTATGTKRVEKVSQAAVAAADEAKPVKASKAKPKAKPTSDAVKAADVEAAELAKVKANVVKAQTRIAKAMVKKAKVEPVEVEPAPLSADVVTDVEPSVIPPTTDNLNQNPGRVLD